MKEKRNLLLGIILSGLIGWMLGFLRLPYLEKNYSFWLGFVACLAIVFLVLIILFVWKKNKQLVTLLGSSSEAAPAQNRAKSYTLIWLMVSAFIFLGGVASSFFIFKQNEFSKIQASSQNKIIAEQSELLESTRKSNLVILMNNIFDKIDEELKDNPQRVLSENTIERIAALNYSFAPYRYLEGDSLSEKSWSPERGQLLLVLSKMKMDSISFSQIKQKTSFHGADLKDANLSGVDLSGVDLHDANMQDANLSGANLSHANLKNTNLWGANLEKANLQKVMLKGSDLKWAELNGADLKNGNLQGVDLTSAKLRGVDLSEADLRWVNFSGALLNQANLQTANFFEANLNRANLTEANLTNAKMNRANMTDANLSKATLRGVELYNAGVGVENWMEKLEEWQVVGVKEIQERFKTSKDISNLFNFRIKNIEK